MEKRTSKAPRKPLASTIQSTYYEGPEPGTITCFYEDDVVVETPQGLTTLTIPGKGILNNRISSYILEGLSSLGIPLSYMAMTNMREQVLIQTVDMPFYMIVRNYLHGERARSLGIFGVDIPVASTMLDFAIAQPSAPLSLEETPLAETETAHEGASPLPTEKARSGAPAYIGADALQSLGWIGTEDLAMIKSTALRINDFLGGLFHGLGLQLLDFKLTFGRILRDYGEDDDIIITAQFTPETCTLIDALSTLSLPLNDYLTAQIAAPEKDRELAKPYQEIARRLSLYTPRPQQTTTTSENAISIKKDSSSPPS